MNYPAIYDPTVAEQGHERLTDQMLRAVNARNREARNERSVRHVVATLQRAQAVQNDQHTREKAALQERNRRLERKIKHRAGWGAISREFTLLGGSWIAYKAMGAGLLKINLAFPLALVAALYGGWLLRCLRTEITKGR